MQVSVIGPAIVDVLAGGVTKQIFEKNPMHFRTSVCPLGVMH